MTDLFHDKAQDWDAQPMPVRISAGVGAALRARVPLGPELRVMDFGAGTGLVCAQVAPHVHTVYAVDISAAMLDQLAAKPELRGKVEVVHQDLLATPLGRPVDLIISAMALHHVEDTARGILSPTRIRANDYRGGPVGLAICLLLMLGACGKSAQFPLHVWLPDAMEGPTPVSALIHAATMVTAGVYMVTRCTPLYMLAPQAQLTISVVGGLTALIAALIALTQTDLKRVLAYSTVSQLGYMFLGLGTGSVVGIAGAMFHLFTHAFFKACLFLGAGSVMHSMGHVIDMRRFSGLRKIMPYTYATFMIGSLALAGLFPLSGF